MPGKKRNKKENPIKGVFVARQPIHDRNMNIFGYELLFREGLDNYYSGINGDYASSKTLTNSFLVVGMGALTKGKRGFVNFTRNLIVNGIAELFPKELIAVEILEDVNPDEDVIDACKKLRSLGYRIVLDDFRYSAAMEPIIRLSDIIKVDILATPLSEQKELISRTTSKRIKFLAEKVETLEQYRQAIDLGYSYFQGYFFSRPVIVEGIDVPGYKLNYLQIIHEANKPDVDFSRLESIIKHDLSITYKFLLLINSAAFGFTSKINSIKQALALLGINEFRKWISLIAMSSMGDDKPRELISVSIIRARFCEEISGYTGMAEMSSDLFLMGMLSLIDAFIDRPIVEILEEIPVSDPVKQALLGKKNLYRAVYELLLAYEHGNWERVSALAEVLKIEENVVSQVYFDAVTWSNSIST